MNLGILKLTWRALVLLWILHFTRLLWFLGIFVLLKEKCRKALYKGRQFLIGICESFCNLTKFYSYYKQWYFNRKANQYPKTRSLHQEPFTRIHPFESTLAHTLSFNQCLYFYTFCHFFIKYCAILDHFRVHFPLCNFHPLGLLEIFTFWHIPFQDITVYKVYYHLPTSTLSI